MLQVSLYQQPQMVLLGNLKAPLPLPLLLLLLLLLVFRLVCVWRPWRQLCRLTSSGQWTGIKLSWMLLHDSRPHPLQQQQQHRQQRQLNEVLLQLMLHNSRLCVTYRVDGFVKHRIVTMVPKWTIDICSKILSSSLWRGKDTGRVLVIKQGVHMVSAAWSCGRRHRATAPLKGLHAAWLSAQRCLQQAMTKCMAFLLWFSRSTASCSYDCVHFTYMFLVGTAKVQPLNSLLDYRPSTFQG
jgi:hypothetical protein